MSFSEANQSSSSHQESRQLATFQEEATESCGFKQTNKSVKTSSMKSSSTMNQSSSSSFQSSSRAQVESSNQSSSMSSMSSSKTMTSSSSFQSGFTKQVWREITIDPSIKSILFVLLTTDVFMVYSLSLSIYKLQFFRKIRFPMLSRNWLKINIKRFSKTIWKLRLSLPSLTSRVTETLLTLVKKIKQWSWPPRSKSCPHLPWQVSRQPSR